MSAGVLIRRLGPFQVLKTGSPLSLRSGGKAEQLLSCLALHPHIGIHRETLVERIWPETSLGPAIQCLNTLTHSLKMQLADALGGQPPIVHSESHYALNLDGGVRVDVLEFESAIETGHRLHSEGSTGAAIKSYERAVDLYRGDLTPAPDISALLERERLRAACLTTLARLADTHFGVAAYDRALETALRLLAIDPCREDAHRMVMRSYVRLGARAQALRQYKLCRIILDGEFAVAPEPATERLFRLIRTDPGQV
ncbi:AfsR/SARP family transcriptional regulator [Gordonia rhizosphera]|uniref:Bacterial transcriptional activator domain-containing protein n=1 Tax=Gordonia rhizosphera NBRC 16068 TaxID=1108045 RepID=K6WP47_9ACTN|nr:bacterial transcriptional activator domain-containing protein [Gordonia rhizosphera]GAB93892.1 hypothetical protein GORHZ_247_00300 [Gordonia rhizosphera NBRC 16068]